MSNKNEEYRGLVRVPKSEIDPKILFKDLRIYGKGYLDATLIIKCYKEDENSYYVPLTYAVKKGLITQDNYKFPKIKVKWPESKFEYRHNQKEVITNTVDYLKKHHSGRISAPTGYGKTITALEIAKRLQTNVLFLVHKLDVLSQVEATAKKYFNTDKCSWLSEKGVTDSKSELISLCTMQTAAIRLEENADFLDDFGLIVYDEAHRTGCNSYITIMNNSKSDYKLAISATFRRGDGLIGVWGAYLGEMIAEGKVTDARIPVLESPLIKGTDITDGNFWNYRKGTLDRVKAITLISENEFYNEWLVDKIISLLKEGRRPMLVTDRKKQLEVLEDLLVNKGVTSIGIYAGGKHRDKNIKQKDLKEAMTKQVVLAIAKKVGEGFDEEMFLTPEQFESQQPLDTIILASLSSDCTQVIGRISRSERAKHPLIVDPVIDTPYCKNKFKTRYRVSYKPVGIEVKNE